MDSGSSQQVGLEGVSYKELRLLEEIQRTPEISQRQLARQLGVALGVANALVRNLAKQGHIRATQIGWKRWVYVVTPSGMNRKLQLTLEYIENFLNHYQRVRILLSEDLADIAVDANAQVAIHGVNELAELIYLALLDLGLGNIEFIDENAAVSDFLGKPVKSLETAIPDHYFKVIVAFPQETEARRNALANGGFGPDQIVTLLSGMSEDTGTVEGLSQLN